MVNKMLAGVSAGLTLVALGLTVGAIYTPHWVDFETSSTQTYEFGLFWMTTDDDDASGAADASGQSWACWQQLYCEYKDESSSDQYDGYCDWSDAMVKGGEAYYICSILCICFMVKYMICQMAILMDRDGGGKIMTLCKGAMICVLSTMAFGFWWGFTGASYSADCEWEDTASDLLDGDKPEMCAGVGATMSIVAFAVSLMAGALACANAFMQADPVAKDYSQDVPCCCGPRVHMVIIKVLLIGAVALSLIGICIRFWVHFEVEVGNDDSTYNGGLFSVRNYEVSSEIELDAYAWDCLAAANCDLDDDTTVCKTFEPLYKSGRLYLQLEVANLIVLFCVLAYLFNGIFFKKDISHPILVHSLPHLAWIIHLVAIICWAVVAEVKFEMGSCDNGSDTDPDEKWDVCISLGPVLTIIQLVLQMVAALWFTFIYMKRGSTEATVPETKGQEK